MEFDNGGIDMKRASIGTMLALLIALSVPSTLLAQSWWEGFANGPDPNAFWSWLQQNPNVSGPLQQNPYQMYNPSWRAQHPQFQQYINNNPGWWNSMVSNGPRYYNKRFSQFLNHHPTIARDLQQNPSLIYDQAYLAQHPQLRQFLANHPNAWQSVTRRNYAYSPNGGWGAYDNQKQWRNSQWWNENGDWDQNRKWHDRNWWQQNNPTVARRRHPNWFGTQQTHPSGAAHQHRHGAQQGQGQNRH
jgi:hypothetical protein